MQQDGKSENFNIKNLTEKTITKLEEVLQLLKIGEINRHYAATVMNHSSSRSHTIFRITVKAVSNNYVRDYHQTQLKQSNENLYDSECQFNNSPEIDRILKRAQTDSIGILKSPKATEKNSIVTESYLNFVDLAGSEKVSSHFDKEEEFGDFSDKSHYLDEMSAKKSRNINDRVKENKAINKSLFFLTHVIYLKSKGSSNEYIPFRNSPLTKILKSSLGGNFRTVVILCCNPSDKQIEHTISTLRFGTNAKKIQNHVKANVLTNNNDKSVKLLIENYERKMEDLHNIVEIEEEKTEQYKSVIEELR